MTDFVVKYRVAFTRTVEADSALEAAATAYDQGLLPNGLWIEETYEVEDPKSVNVRSSFNENGGNGVRVLVDDAAGYDWDPRTDAEKLAESEAALHLSEARFWSDLGVELGHPLGAEQDKALREALNLLGEEEGKALREAYNNAVLADLLK